MDDSQKFNRRSTDWIFLFVMTVVCAFDARVGVIAFGRDHGFWHRAMDAFVAITFAALCLGAGWMTARALRAKREDQ